MLRLFSVAVALSLALSWCTGSARDTSSPKVPTTLPTETTFATLGIDDWTSGSTAAWATLPAAPDGFSDELLQRMGAEIEPWAERATLSADVRAASAPAKAAVRGLPGAPAAHLMDQASSSVTPRLSLVNVFADGVEVLDTRYTSAWEARAVTADDGRTYLSLSLQSRTAYEVRQSDRPVQVIGMLRVHTLTAYPDTADEFGSGYAWQEFGAADCALATTDKLVPDSGPSGVEELVRFVRIGNRTTFNQPPLEPGDRVDEGYEQECESGAA